MIKRCLVIFLCIINVAILLMGCKGKLTNRDATKTMLELDVLVSSMQETNDEILYSKFSKIVDELKNFSDDDTLMALKNDEISDATKHVIIKQIAQINNGEGIMSQSEFEKLLTDNTLAQSNKLALIYVLDFEKIESLEILENIVYLENSVITIKALEKIKHASPITALNLSNEIIANCDNYGEYQIKAAIITKSDYLRDMSVNEFKNVSEKEIDEYISFCIKRFETAKDNNSGDSMIFLLMNINHIKAAREIIFHDSVADTLKTLCVRKNYYTFLKILKDDISNEDLECIIKAMQITPIKELGVALKEIDLSENLNPTLNLNAFIDEIQKRGIDADPKWIITEQQYNWN